MEQLSFPAWNLKKKVLFIRQAQILYINSVSKNMFKCGQFSRQKTTVLKIRMRRFFFFFFNVKH